MSNDARWQKILAAQATADKKKEADEAASEVAQESEKQLAKKVVQIWSVKERLIEDRIRQMNEQMGGGRKLYPKTEATEPMTAGVLSITTQQRANSPRCEFKAHHSGTLTVTYKNPSLPTRHIDLEKETNKEIDEGIKDALYAFVESALK